MSFFLHEPDWLRFVLYNVLVTDVALATLKIDREVHQASSSSHYSEGHKDVSCIISIVWSLSDIIWFEMNIFPTDSYTTLRVHVEDGAAQPPSFGLFIFSDGLRWESRFCHVNASTWKRDVNGDKPPHTEWMWSVTMLVCKKQTKREKGEEWGRAIWFHLIIVFLHCTPKSCVQIRSREGGEYEHND